MKLTIQLGLGGSREACSDWINKDQVGAVKPCRLIVNQPKWWSWNCRLFRQSNSSRAQSPEMQPYRCRPGPTVKAKHKRALGDWSGAIQGVCHEEDPRFHLRFSVFEWHQTDRCRVRQFLAIDQQPMMGNNGLLVGRGLGFF